MKSSDLSLHRVSTWSWIPSIHKNRVRRGGFPKIAVGKLIKYHGRSNSQPILFSGSKFVNCTVSNLCMLAIILHSLCSQGLHLEVRAVCGDRQNTEGVGVAKTALPSLHSNDGRSRSDQLQVQSVAETETNTVVNLEYRKSTLDSARSR